MAKSAPTRVNADIAAAAASVASSENRTVAEQINHWARIGMQVERSTSVDARRARAVITCEEQFSTLSAQERTVAHATIDAAMAVRVADQRFGPAARRAGQVTVSIDEDGNLVEIAPDGTRRPLAQAVPRCHRTVIYDNAGDAGPAEVPSFRYGIADHTPRWPTWTPEPLRLL